MVTKASRVPKRIPDDRVFRAIADPTRRSILQLLSVQSYSVGDLASKFRVSRPAISKHLRLLREVGLVTDKPRGTTTMCELDAEPLQTIDNWLNNYKRFWDRSLLSLKAHVEKQK